METVLQVPHTTFLLTHVCFLFYHVSSNMTLRRIQHSVAHLPETTQWLFKASWILILSYFVAYLETVAISNVSKDTNKHWYLGFNLYAFQIFINMPFLYIDIF